MKIETQEKKETAQLFQNNWRSNLLYDDSYIETLLNSFDISDTSLSASLLAWLQTHYNASQFKSQSEAQLENSFIRPLLEHLNWVLEPQISISVQGKNVRPDWALFQDMSVLVEFRNYTNQPENQLANILVFLEAKDYITILDKSKHKNEKSPHQQLMEYLHIGRKRYGFLTNGRFWRFYDVEKISKTKSYLEIDLEALLEINDIKEQRRAIALFERIFAQANYLKAESTTSRLEDLSRNAYEYASEVEENLKAVIYGTNGENSMFELIGKSIHERSPKQDLASIYDNSIIMLFRLLFIVYFEDKNQTLLIKHHYYRKYSLQNIFDALDKSEPTQFDGFYALKNLFTILDEGAEDIDIPLFNGGLFDPERAPLLLPAKIFNNQTLRQILEQLLYKTNRGTTLFEHRRDYKNMSVTHIGRIYEGLLEFSFQIAEENSVYLEYRIGNNPSVEAYFDSYDLANIQKEKGFVEISRQTVKKNSFVLKSNNNSRKSSASYYTPTSLSNYLVEAGINYALARENPKPLMDLKIIDNACGSGHFLVEALNYLTHLGVMRLGEDVGLKKLVEEERVKINTQIKSLNIQDYEPEDAQILKRALLKRCIYGVDLNPFAVELARLSLWIDSFIFGTPLSFIEHHIQHGNALIGSSEEDFANLLKQHYEETAQGTLNFDNTIEGNFDGLEDAANKLNSLQDTSTSDIKHSKEIYRNEVKPQLEQLARTLSFVSMCDIQSIEGELDKNRQIEQLLKLKRMTFFEGDYLQSSPRSPAKRALLAEIEAYQKQYVFFHYDVAFPEAREGFDIIVGNPPWDKTKFTDLDFFPYYSSNYRTLKNSEKQAIQNNLLEKKHIKALYEAKSRNMEIAKLYYKKHFPLNAGNVDGNLFRLFVERNLSLLANGGSLNYVLPSALMFEEGSQSLRKHILNQYTMPFFYSFENREALFIDVHRSYKFALMQIANTPPRTDAKIESAFYLSQPEELTSTRIVEYPLTAIKALSSEQWAMMELRNQRDLSILQKCYSAFKPLSEQWLDFRRELHMTDDKDLFVENDGDKLLPLFEGKMIWQFSDQHDKAQYWVNENKFDDRLRNKELYRMAQDTGLSFDECDAYHSKSITYDRQYYRLGYRNIASDTNERTLVFSLLPKNCAVGNSMNFNNPKKYVLQSDGTVSADAVSALRTLFAEAWFNSLPCDWLARFMIQINVNKTYLIRLPLPQPTDAEILNNMVYSTLAKNALLLTIANSPNNFGELFGQIAPMFSLIEKDIPKSQKAQDKLRHQNDTLVSNAYGISDKELKYILESFNVLRNKRPEYVALFGD